MKILAIETSCDETAAAVVESESPTRPVKVLSNIVTSSEEMHKKTGGIVPEVASREQVKAIIPVIDMALAEARISKFEIRNKIDAIAVTVGPGLIGSLLVGVETARALAYAWEKPIIPVNHLIAHLYANFIINSKFKAKNAKQQFKTQNIPEFPAIGLVVSGGHTDLVLIAAEKIRLLGTTRDDAAGECFDKGSRLLQLGYPGGPAIARAASEFKRQKAKGKIKLPRPLIHEDTYDFSFSGLKTAVVRQVAKVADVAQVAQEIAYEVQEAIVEVLVERVMRAVEEFRPKSVLLGGGVAANSRLRESLNEKLKMQPVRQAQGKNAKLFIPPVELCTDNAAMIGAAALRLSFDRFDKLTASKLRIAQGKLGLTYSWKEVRVDPELEIV